MDCAFKTGTLVNGTTKNHQFILSDLSKSWYLIKPHPNVPSMNKNPFSFHVSDVHYCCLTLKFLFKTRIMKVGMLLSVSIHSTVRDSELRLSNLHWDVAPCLVIILIFGNFSQITCLWPCLWCNCQSRLYSYQWDHNRYCCLDLSCQ